MTTKILLRGGCVLTLGAKTSNYAEADLLIEDGRIAEVGQGVRARDAEQVDAGDTIVMPAFVDTHRHAWRSLLRNLGQGGGGVASLGERYRAEDVYAATLIGLLGAVEAGITTVVDWSDLPFDAERADAALQAHADAGLRTVFACAPEGGQSGEGGEGTRRHLTRLTDRAGPSTSIAFGPGDLGRSDLDPSTAGWEVAGELGLPIHAHGDPTTRPGTVARLAQRGLLGPDVTLVHCAQLDDADLGAIEASGASVSLAPSSEMAERLGSPPIQELIDRAVRPGLGVDDEREAPGDMFAQMRATISMQHATVFDRKLAGKAGLPRLMTTRDVIRCATIEGARVAGLGEVTGSLEPGKQADVLVLRTDRPNIFPINDPIGAVVWGMDTSNVDWVIAGGRVLMRDGVLQADVQGARAVAAEARERVGAAAGAASGGEG